MPQLIVFNHITLDGYFAGANGDISFLRPRFKDEEFHSVAVENINATGTLLFGRVTYEVMLSHWPTPNAIKDDPAIAERMNGLPKFVLSRTLSNSSWNNTHFLNGDTLPKCAKSSNRLVNASPSWAAAPSSRNSRRSVSSMNMKSS